MDEYEYDEGSDIDNWETEQVFRDNEGEDDEDDKPEPIDQFFADLLKIMESVRH